MDVSYQDLELEMIMNANKRVKKADSGEALQKTLRKSFQILEQRILNNNIVINNPDKFLVFFELKTKEILAAFEKELAGKSD